MVMDKKLEGFASIRAAMSLPLAPLEYVISWPTNAFVQVKNIINTRDDLMRENLRLKSDQLLLQSQLQRLISIESENNYLKSLLLSAQKTTKNKTLIAELLSVDFEPFVNQVVVNKGSRDGVYLGQSVLDANGVMGQIIEVGPITSRVMLINDSHSGIAVQNVRNGMRTVAVGDNYTEQLRLMYVAKTSDVKEGDIFITSGLGGHYPEGYPVGRVASVKNDPANQFATVYLKPSAHLDSSRQVLLVWSQRHA